MKCCYAVIAVSLLAVAASPLESGLAKLAIGEDAAALALLDEAKSTAADPGLVAFHRGLALARLGRFAEAEAAFRQSLDDAEIPARRRADACYNRGVCLIECGTAGDLKLAIDCLAACRDLTGDDAQRADAKHNLAIAKLKLQKLKPSPTEENNGNTGEKSKSGGTDDTTAGESNTSEAAKAAAAPRPGKAKEGAAGTGTMAPGAGTLPVLRDEGVLSPLSPGETEAALDAVEQRLLRQRRSVDAMRAGPERPKVKDW